MDERPSSNIHGNNSDLLTFNMSWRVNCAPLEHLFLGTQGLLRTIRVPFGFVDFTSGHAHRSCSSTLPQLIYNPVRGTELFVGGAGPRLVRRGELWEHLKFIQDRFDNGHGQGTQVR